MKSMLFLFTFIAILHSGMSWAKTGISIMAYNVENLFTPDHDPAHNDWSFTPLKLKGKTAACRQMVVPSHRNSCLLSDWTVPRLELKLEQIRRAVTNNGLFALPQILALTEIENEAVIAMLARHLGYESYVVTQNADDERGLDVALLYNESKELKLLDQESVLPDYKSLETTYRKKGIAWEARAFLVVTFNLSGNPLKLVINHLPSQLQKPAVRQFAAEALGLLSAEWEKQKIPFILMGDFNIVEKEAAVVFAQIEKTASSLHEIALAAGSALPQGTYFYPGQEQWNLLDRFFLSRDLIMGTSALKVKPASYQILNHTFLSQEYKLKNQTTVLIPKRYDFLSDDPEAAGFSDHYPIVLEIGVEP